VTSYQLYAIYVGAYADSSHFAAEGEAGPRRAYALPDTWLSSIERAIAELAVHDATNGTPMRSKAQFDRSLEEGAPLLHRLNLRDRRFNRAGEVAGRQLALAGLVDAQTR